MSTKLIVLGITLLKVPKLFENTLMLGFLERIKNIYIFLAPVQKLDRFINPQLK